MNSQLHKPTVLFLSYDENRENLQRYVLEVSDKLSAYRITTADNPDLSRNMPVAEIASHIDMLTQHCDIVIVLAGKGANRQDKVWTALNALNQTNYEIRKAIAYEKDIIAVHIQPDGVIPNELRNSKRTIWVPHFSVELIAAALESCIAERGSSAL